jgi:hypothetical protein
MCNAPRPVTASSTTSVKRCWARAPAPIRWRGARRRSRGLTDDRCGGDRQTLRVDYMRASRKELAPAGSALISPAIAAFRPNAERRDARLDRRLRSFVDGVAERLAAAGGPVVGGKVWTRLDTLLVRVETNRSNLQGAGPIWLAKSCPRCQSRQGVAYHADACWEPSCALRGRL